MLGFMGIWWVLGCILIIAILFSLTRGSMRWLGNHHGTSLELLGKRYAKGELSDEEYESKKSRLEKDARGTGHA
jgi:uncharacterized membrane protein